MKAAPKAAFKRLIPDRISHFKGDKAVEVASDEIADNKTGIKKSYLGKMCHSVLCRDCHVVECIGKTVREAAVDEEGHTEQQGQRFAFASKGDDRSHDEATANGKKTCTQRTDGKTTLKYLLCLFAQFHG